MATPAPLDVARYAEQVTERLVQAAPGSSTDWRDVVDRGMAAAYEQSDAAALTSMVQVIAHLLDAKGRFEDAVGEIDHALVHAAAAPEARIILCGLKAAMLAAPGKFEAARAALAEGESVLPEVGTPNAIRFLIYRRLVLWQMLDPGEPQETKALLASAADNGLRRDRTFLLTWYVPFLAASGDRRLAHPWIRAVRLDAEASRSRWRASDAAAFEAWDDFLKEPEERRARSTLDPANALSVWRGEAVRLRDAVLRRDGKEAESALESMRRARRRVGSANLGELSQFPGASDGLEVQGLPSCPPPATVSLNTLGAWLAQAETVAMRGTQQAAGEWLGGLDAAIPAHVFSSLEWPVSVLRLKGLLALRAGMIRRAKSDLEDAVDWSRSAGSLPEEGLSLLQLGELCANADLRVAERTWQGLRRDGAARLRMLGYDPTPHGYAAAHSVTLSSRTRLAERLTAREVDVLGLLAVGQTYREAAATLGIAKPTVQTLAHRAYQKLGMSGRHKAVAEAKRLGVL